VASSYGTRRRPKRWVLLEGLSTVAMMEEELHV